MVGLVWRLCLLILLFTVVLQGRLNAQHKQPISNQCIIRNQLVKNTLAKGNTLYSAIENNETGTGLNLPWMEKMKSLNVKQATGEVAFNVKDDQISLTLKRMVFLSKYYDFTSTIAFKTSAEPQWQRKLHNELRTVFFVEALNVLERGKGTNSDCGSLYLNLLDDACIPVLNEIPDFRSDCREG